MSETIPTGADIAQRGAELEARRARNQQEFDTSDPSGYEGGRGASYAQELYRERREVLDAQRELVEREAVTALAGALHEDWRKTRLNEDGSYEPRLKTTKDEAWIESHGTDEVDIANTTFEDLPEDWQAENKAAAEVVVGIMVENDGKIDLNDPRMREKVGHKIHKEWLGRNEWAAGGELDVPFVQLPPAEQAKDLDQVRIAQEVFTPDNM